jgi:hypothetical protein
MFVTSQRENIRPSKKEINKALTMLIMPDVCSLAMNHVSLSLTNRECSVHLHALYSPLHSALRTFTSLRDQLVICG